MVKILIWTCALSILACGASTSEDIQIAKTNNRMDTTVAIGGFKVRIIKPNSNSKSAGTLLLLPGWNFSDKMWCDSSDVCETALSNGLTVVAPEMGKSIYATEYFPETRDDYRKYPTLTWLDSAIEILKKRNGVFGSSAEQRNFILGLSTGARGVALICAKKPGFFHAAAMLSGDYNQAAITDDPLCTIVYGPYQKYSNRWKTIDNPSSQIEKFI